MATEKTDVRRSQLTQAVGEITGTRWCGYHQGHADAKTGQFLERNGKRWMCLNCLIRRGIIEAQSSIDADEVKEDEHVDQKTETASR